MTWTPPAHLGFLHLTWRSHLIPPDIWDGFFFDAFAHLASYAVGFVGGLVVIIKTWAERRVGELNGFEHTAGHS